MKVSCNLMGIATPVCALARNDMLFGEKYESNRKKKR